MPKKPLYDDKTLTDAVREYSAHFPGSKIIVSELASWVRQNISGLEHVQAYHFLRKTVNVYANGRKSEVKKECTRLIEQLNHEYDISKEGSVAWMFSEAELTEFMNSPKYVQERSILKARTLFRTLREKLTAALQELSVEKETRQILEKKLKESVQPKNIITYDAKISELNKQFSRLQKQLDEMECRETLSREGITEYRLDLNRYASLLRELNGNIFHFSETIMEDMKYEKLISSEAEKMAKPQLDNIQDCPDIIDKLMKGIE